MLSALSSEVNVLSHMLDEISSTNRRARDFTRKVLRDAIRETIACFPVYRTYVDERGHISDRDREFIAQAIAAAKRTNSTKAPQVFDFLQDILLLREDNGGAPIYGYRNQLYFALKFQQLTGPVMAKGLEDTVCYVYNRFISVNEVGGNPGTFGVAVEEFHQGNRERAELWPSALLTTSTHDTKRSEDVRMRLDVLSEMPRPGLPRSCAGGASTAPSARPSTMAASCPITTRSISSTRPWRAPGPCRPARSFSPTDWALSREERLAFTARIQAYMEKAVHEGKINLSWINPNQEYTEALRRFVARILSPGTESKPNNFLRLMHEFIPRLAWFGVINSLAETLLKLTSPGVPDIYQGQELFNFTLVIPTTAVPWIFLSQKNICGSSSTASPARSCAASCWSTGRMDD